LTSLLIGARPVGNGAPTYLIAEISANHGGSFERALETVHAIKDTGADAVKIQTYTPDTITLDSKMPPFVIEGTLWEGRNLYDLYAEAMTPWEWHAPLQAEAQKLGLDFFSTAFDPTAVDFLENLGVQVHKIASFELVDLPLIEKMARTGKPMILSTGMASLDEIEEAVNAARGAGATQIALLWCNSAYPAPPTEMNLRVIPHLSENFGVPVGLSDHTLGTTAATVAVSLGASIIEKHFTLSRANGGPDSAFSLEPHEFALMVSQVREAEKMLGSIEFGPREHERASLKFRRSLFVMRDIKAGEVLNEENVRSIRPAGGLAPKFWREIEGKKARRSLLKGEPLNWEMVSNLYGNL
jgi:N-acetylneuraminate synthase